MPDDTALQERLFSVEGKVVVVTGGSRGLGRALVLGLARAGADLIVSSRKLESCEMVAAEAEKFGIRAVPLACHMGRWADVDSFVDRAYRAFPSIDGLINNAGMAPVAPSMVDITEKLFDATIGVNLKGALRLSCLIGSRMKVQGRGSIVNVSSGAAVMPEPRTAVYAAAKAGLNALTAALAIEYGPEVRVNAIGLGPTDTDASSGWFHTEAFKQAAVRGIALQRGAAPDEILGTVIYLLSAASSFTTRSLVTVDGGIYGNLGSSTEVS